MKQLNFLKQFISHYKKQTVVISGLFVLVVAIGITCAFNATKEIKVVVDQNIANAEKGVQTSTLAAPLMTPINEVLQENGYPVSDDYTINVESDKKVKDVDSVILKKKAVGELIVDGKKIPFKSSDETVGDLLASNAVKYDKDDAVTPAVETKLTTEVKAIKVARVEIKEEKVEKELPFETEEKENADLKEGEKNVVTPGVLGKAEVVEKITYQDGVEIARETLSSQTIIEPVKEVVDVGTKKTVAVAEAKSSSQGASSSSSETSSGGGSSSSGNSIQSAGSDFDLICAIVAHEGGTSYEGALGVISCVMNRVDSGFGSSAIDVLTAPGQFSSYLDGYYTQYLGNTPSSVQQAVRDCMEGGVRSHSYTSFRSYETSGSVCIAGNWYF
ncbi:MAG: G5 domain-containing protein [Eubacterium sp.]